MARIVNRLQKNVRIWLPKQECFQFSSERWQWWGSSNIARNIVPESPASRSKRAFPDGCKAWRSAQELTVWRRPKSATRRNVSNPSQHPRTGDKAQCRRVPSDGDRRLTVLIIMWSNLAFLGGNYRKLTDCCHSGQTLLVCFVARISGAKVETVGTAIVRS